MDDPEGTEWICNIVWDLLKEWEPPEMECEDDYTDDLCEFLMEEISEVLEEEDPDVAIEKRTNTLHGIPDILIHDRLVLEVKVSRKRANEIVS